MDNPAEVLSDLPMIPSREQTEKKLMDKYPGHISWATSNAHHAGCRFVTFSSRGVHGLEAIDARVFSEQLNAGPPMTSLSAAELLNMYFSTRANLLLIHAMPDGGAIHCVITTQLDEEDLEAFQEIQVMNQLAMREVRAKQDKRRAARLAAAAEAKRLQEVGKRAEDHNLAGRVRELEEENAALRKAADK